MVIDELSQAGKSLLSAELIVSRNSDHSHSFKIFGNVAKV